MKNIKEFKELIERYESITLEEIEATGPFVCDQFYLVNNYSTINNLIGFGRSATCMLCNALLDKFCFGCVYCHNNQKVMMCARYPFNRSFDKIRDASNAEELLLAVKERAKVMREYLKTIEP